MVANEVNKFGQIFPIHRRWKDKKSAKVQNITFGQPKSLIQMSVIV
jgi:hypothetical protein